MKRAISSIYEGKKPTGICLVEKRLTNGKLMYTIDFEKKSFACVSGNHATMAFFEIVRALNDATVERLKIV